MIRYPIFLFDRDKLDVFETESDLWSSLCCLDCASGHLDEVFGSDARAIAVTDEDSGETIDSVGEPQPERLRQLLILALQTRYKVDSTTPLDTLIATARKKVYGYNSWSADPIVADAVANLLRLLRLRKPGPKGPAPADRR
jgi:hypothetical protein